VAYLCSSLFFVADNLNANLCKIKSKRFIPSRDSEGTQDEHQSVQN